LQLRQVADVVRFSALVLPRIFADSLGADQCSPAALDRQCGLEVGTVQRNALVQRDNALVTRWWSLKSMNTNANALVEFAFHGDNALRSFF